MRRLITCFALCAAFAFGQSPSARVFTFSTVPDGANEWTEAQTLQLTDGSFPVRIAAQSLATGSPTTCTYKLQGSLADSPAAAVQADLNLTNDGTAPADTATVTIGTTIYTFKTALSTGPTVAYEVLIGADGNAALDNLILAINGGAGEGTNYSTGTVAHTLVTASARATATTTVTATIAGPSGNAIATAADTTPDSHMDWEGAGVFLAGGLDADWVDINSAVSCLPDNAAHLTFVVDKPVRLIRAYLVTFGGGSSPTLPVRILATR